MDEIENTSYIIPEPLETQDYDVVGDMVGTIQTPRDTVSNSEFVQFSTDSTNAFSNLLGGSEPKKKGFQNEGFQVGEAYDRLSDGTYSAKYENFLQGVDNEDRLAQGQSAGEQWKNGLIKFFGKTATAIGGGTIGTLYGLGDAITSGDWTAIYDNDFYDVMDDWNKQMDNGLSNYYTKEQRDMGFLESAGTANFWANDFLGGLSFTAGAIASEAIWAGATGGTSLIAAAGRYGLKGAKGLSSIVGAKKATSFFTNQISKARNIDKAVTYGRYATGINTARMMYTSAGYEAGVESRMFKQEQEEAFDNYFKEIGREPTAIERSKFTSALNDKTNAVFITNMGLVGSSNLLIFGKLFNVGNPLKGTSRAVKKTLFGEGVELVDNTLKPIKRNVTQRVAGTAYHAFKNPIIEGVYEEGGQSVASGTAGNLIESMYNVDKDVMEFSEAFYEGMAHTYGTKEGRKEVYLGMLIGAVGGGGSSALAGQNPFAKIKDASRKVSKTDLARVQQYEAGTNSKETASLLTGAYGNEVSQKVIEELARANALSASTKQMNDAVESGDLHNYEQGRISGIMSNIIYAENTGLSDLVEQQIFTDIDNTPNSDFAEVGQKDKDIDFDKLKEDAKAEYSKLKKEFSKAKEFSNYVIGNLGRKEVKELGKSTETLRTMLAYQQVMTSRTVAFAEELNASVIDEIGKYVGQDFQGLKTASEIKLALDQAGTEKTKSFYNLNRRVKRTKDAYEKTTKQIESQAEQLTSTPEGQQAKTAKLLKLQNKQKELLEQKDTLKLERDLLLQTIKVQTNSNKDREDTSIDLSISQDVDNLEENLETISRTIEDISKRDYEKYVKIKSAITAYQKAIVSSKQMSEIIEDLTNSKTQLKGATRTFLSTAKEYSEPSQRLIKNLEAIHEQKGQEAIERGNIREIVAGIKPEAETTLDPLAEEDTSAEDKQKQIDAINEKYDRQVEKVDNEQEQSSNNDSQKEEIEKSSKIVDIITTQLDSGINLNTILNTLLKQGYVVKNNNSSFTNSEGRDIIIFNINGATVPVYRSFKGTDSKTKNTWYPLLFNTNDWLVKGMSDNYKEGYNNPIIKQILSSLNSNYKYDTPKATKENNTQELLENFISKKDAENILKDNIGIFDVRNYAVALSIFKNWSNKLGKVSLNNYKEYLDNSLESLIKENKNKEKELRSLWKPIYDRFVELEALENKQDANETKESRIVEINKKRNQELQALNSNTQTIEQAIDETLAKYEGLIENLTDPQAVKPTEDDFSRYIELINQSKINSDMLLRKSYENASKRTITKTGLSKEEIKEFQELSKKLADWQIISGMTNNEVSLKDLLDQKLAMATEASKTTNSPITPEQEIEMIQGIVNEGSTREMKAKNINTSDSVLVQKKGEEYNISHFKVEEYDENIEIVKIKEPTKKELGTLTFRKGEQEFTVGTTVTGRYVIDNEEDFNKFLDILDLKVMSFKGQKNTWSALYSKNEEGQYELQDSFFEVNEVDSLENIIDSSKLYDVKPGEKIFFKVSLKDAYNTKLINDPKTTDKKLKDNVSIYVVNGKGNVLGQVKASNKYTEHTDKTKAIREQAGQFILDQTDPDKARFENVDGTAKSTEISEMLLPFYTTVTRVYSGTPSVKLDSQGELIQQAIPEGSISSYGIYKNGEIILNSNSKVKVDDVSKTYLNTIDNTPIIIVKVGKKHIAYPAQIKAKQENLGSQLVEILNSQDTESEKIVKISKFLADNGISPTKYNLKHIGADNSSLYDGTMERIIEDVKGIATYISEEEYLSKEFGPTRLEQEVTTSLNLSDRPFRNPKLEMSTEGITKDDKISDVYYERQLASTGTLPESYLEKVSLKLDIDLKPLDKLTTFNKKVISLYKDKITEMVQERLKMTGEKQKESAKLKNEEC